ncbi:deleted in malignant brain tumors 1 protein-like [Haliotis asinina]|uniref:deleted in malignant brain tumors 1 protein-like n=1 Tax=Haliotis asinina TaxID=109174 RepID=UPI00353205F6
MRVCVNLALFLLFTATAAKAQSCDADLQVSSETMFKSAVVGSGGTCTWTVTNSQLFGSVQVTFVNVSLSHHPSCDDSNSIVVHDGDLSGLILGLICRNISSTFRSSGSVLTVRYPTAEVTDTDAFVLRYSQSRVATCSGPSVTAVSTTEYSILSNGYPDGFLVSIECTWYVRAPKGQRVRLFVETAGIASNTCEDAKVTFLEFQHPRSNVTWCPGRINVYQSWSSVAILQLEVSNNRSVRVRYRAVEGDTCGSEDLRATPEEQFLMTPGYPNPFPSYLECRWTIQNSNRKSGAIRIDILEVDMECSTDLIRVYDAITSTKKLIGTVCRELKSFYVYGRSAMVEFRSLRDSNTKSGFKLKYYNTTAEPCGGNLAASSTRQNVTSPGYPVNYPISFKCVWTISAENPDQHVKLTFLAVDLYKILSSYGDTVFVYDGNTIDGYLLGTVTEKDTPTFTSQEASITVQFKTDDYDQLTILDKAGFIFGYEEAQTTPPLNRVIRVRLSPSTLLSPRFPDGDVMNMNATWTLRADWAGQKVLLSFEDVDLGEASDCNNNYIMVFQGSTSSDEFSKICGNETGKYLSRDREITVVFKTDSNLARRGFKSVQAFPKYGAFDGCLGETYEVTAYSGSPSKLESPLYPDSYPNMMNCSTRLKSIFDDYFIMVEVTNMSTPHPEDTDCTRDYVEIFDGSSPNDPSLGRACGKSLLKVKSTGNEVFIMFISDANIGDKGYLIQYRADHEERPYSPPIALIVGLTLGCGAVIVAYIVYLVLKKRKGSAPI